MMHQRNTKDRNLNKLITPGIDANSHVNKRLCLGDNVINMQNHNEQYNIMNFISEDMQFLLDNTDYNEEEINSNDSTYSEGSSTLSSEDDNLEYWLEMENDNEFVLGDIYTLEQRCMVNLLKILEDMNCPDTAVTKIIKWAKTSYDAGFDFNPASKTRHGNLQWMKKMTVNNSAFFPKLETVHLNDETKIDVVCYDFTVQLLRLLQNKRLMTQDNLLIDIKNPTKMYESVNNILGEALSGSEYKAIYRNQHENHTGNNPLLVVPICIWGDVTHIDTASRFKLEPISFSPLIFKETVRRDRSFWGMLGYIKQLKTTTAQRKGLKQGDPARFYHRQLSAILDSLIKSKEKLKNVAIQFEDKFIRHFDISCPIMYIISDTEGADKLCG